MKGRAIAQAVSRRLPTAAARVRAPVRSYGFSGGQSSTGAGFPSVLGFPLPILIPPISPQSSSSSVIRDWYNSPNSGSSTKWTQSHPMRKKIHPWDSYVLIPWYLGTETAFTCLYRDMFYRAAPTPRGHRALEIEYSCTHVWRFLDGQTTREE
jgi:hypothetical protein